MKKKTFIKIALGIVALGIISAALVYFFVYNKPHPDYEKAKPAHILSAFELFDGYRTDRQQAEEKYNGKVVVISGRLEKIETIESTVTAVFVFDQGMFGDEGVRCVMLPNHAANLQSFHVGSTIQIKGFVTGYNETDVIMESCSLIL